MNFMSRLLLGAWLLSNVGNPLWAQAASATRTSPSKSATSASAAAAANDPDYKIGAQDVLRIDVWKEADVTRTTPVRPDGKISLPLLNDAQATGLTPMQLTPVITEGLKKYITNPQVTVGLLEINSRRIFVNREVLRAAAFPLLPNMTVLQTLLAPGIHAISEDQKGLRVAYER
jgi:polysaccharide export outer membrane protein